MTAQQTPAAVVEVYWRPGCPFCHALLGPLRRSGVAMREINIWDDPLAAARVRGVARGNETVPTVFVGDQALVNPSVALVLAAARGESLPTAEPTTGTRWAPVAAALAIATVWLLLAARTPTTTYHLAPLTMAAAAPVVRRWLDGVPLSSRVGAVFALIGLALAVATTTVLAALGMLAGPDVTGRHAPVVESVLAAVIGAVTGWWLARRHGRTQARPESTPSPSADEVA